MSRRVVAKKQIPKSVRAWVKNFKGKDLYGEYRKHYHTSRAVTTIELAMLGVSFPAEQIEDAKRGQSKCIEFVRARKARKAQAKAVARELKAEGRNVPQPEPSNEMLGGWCGADDDLFDLSEQDWDAYMEAVSLAEPPFDYDPFADE